MYVAPHTEGGGGGGGACHQISQHIAAADRPPPLHMLMGLSHAPHQPHRYDSITLAADPLSKHGALFPETHINTLVALTLDEAVLSGFVRYVYSSRCFALCVRLSLSLSCCVYVQPTWPPA